MIFIAVPNGTEYMICLQIYYFLGSLHIIHVLFLQPYKTNSLCIRHLPFIERGAVMLSVVPSKSGHQGQMVTETILIAWPQIIPPRLHSAVFFIVFQQERGIMHMTFH